MFIMSVCICFALALLLSIDDIDVCFHFSYEPFFGGMMANLHVDS